MLIIPKPIRRSVIDALLIPTGVLDAVLVGLLAEAHEPSANDTFAEVDAKKATFTGYAASTAVVWGDTFLGAEDEAVVVGDVKQFSAGAIAGPQTIHGYYLFKGAALVGVEMFDIPQQITEQFDAVIVIPRFSFGQ